VQSGEKVRPVDMQHVREKDFCLEARIFSGGRLKPPGRRTRYLGNRGHR
jgi:hypothetical protein